MICSFCERPAVYRVTNPTISATALTTDTIFYPTLLCEKYYPNYKLRDGESIEDLRQQTDPVDIKHPYHNP